MKTLLKSDSSTYVPGQSIGFAVSPGAAAQVQVADGKGILKRTGFDGTWAKFILTPHSPLVRIFAKAAGFEASELVVRAVADFSVMPNSLFESLAIAQNLETMPCAFPNRLGPRARKCIDLSGKWAISPDPDDKGESLGFHSMDIDDSSWKRLNVPGNYGRQDPALKNVFYPVWYRRRFTMDKLDPNQRAYLLFHGIDYFAKVYLNSNTLDNAGEHEGYFNPFSFDVTNKLRPGENVLSVRVQNPWDYAMESAQKHGYLPACEKIWIKGILNYHDTRPGSINLGAKEAQSLGTGGIVQPVEMIITGEVSIEWLRIRPLVADDFSKGKLVIGAYLFNHTMKTMDVTLAIRLSGVGFEHFSQKALRLSVPPGPWSANVVLEVPSPRLWWPASHPELGKPSLYKLQVEVHGHDRIMDQASEKIGFRKIELKKHGRAMVWKVNGKRMFIRGANLIPTIYIAESGHSLHQRLLQSVIESNLDGIIVLDHLQPRSFYRLCDEMGILVFQEFTLVWEYSVANHKRACGDPGLTNNMSVMKRMLAEALLLYESHPSILWWSLHDEPFFTFNVPLDTGRKVPDIIFDSTDQMPILMDGTGNKELDQELYETAVSIERSRPIQKTGNEGTESTVYYGWYNGSYTDIFGAKFPLPIEYGAQAVPFKAEEFILEHGAKMWPVTNDDAARAWMYRCLQLPYLSARIGRTSDYSCFGDWAFASQMYQALVLKYNIEYLRARRYAPTGSSHYFLLNSYWPSVTWATMDDDGRSMPGYRWAATANQPILAFVPHRHAVMNPKVADDIPVLLINDLHREIKDALLIYTVKEKSSGFLLRSDPSSFAEGFKDLFWNPKSLKNEIIVLGGGFEDRRQVFKGKLELDIEPDSIRQVCRLNMRNGKSDLQSPMYVHIDLDVLDAAGNLLSHNWHDFLIINDENEFLHNEPGISPIPRFDLDIESTPGGEIELQRRFGAPISRAASPGENSLVHFSGLEPGVYAVKTPDVSWEVTVDRSKKIIMPASKSK
ncbi:MAG: hypothetical protein GXP49_07125 [Deltaproteobacteria bacterium]|nr:hypothetical protein [Deltaproteobacteria bacterium]